MKFILLCVLSVTSFIFRLDAQLVPDQINLVTALDADWQKARLQSDKIQINDLLSSINRNIRSSFRGSSRAVARDWRIAKLMNVRQHAKSLLQRQMLDLQMLKLAKGLNKAQAAQLSKISKEFQLKQLQYELRYYATKPLVGEQLKLKIAALTKGLSPAEKKRLGWLNQQLKAQFFQEKWNKSQTPEERQYFALRKQITLFGLHEGQRQTLIQLSKKMKAQGIQQAIARERNPERLQLLRLKYAQVVGQLTPTQKSQLDQLQNQQVQLQMQKIVASARNPAAKAILNYLLTISS